jgi:Protein of unknown function (DUF2878)
MLVIVNVVLNYAAWFAVAGLAARGQFAWAVLPPLMAVAIHLALTERARRRPELLLCLAALPIGLVVESINIASGATQYAQGASLAGLPPLFMLGLWMAFATMTNVSLGWLKERPGLAALFGALAAPLSYYAGAKLGALTIGEPVWQSLAIIGAAWAVALPALLWIARRIS